MRIAVVAPSPVPFTIGGAETVWWNLVQRINDDTPHLAELIKLPTKEHSLADLWRSYEMFAGLDLRHFDMVITGKYPAWMIDHPNHVVYMLHRLRGLYDCYGPTGETLSGLRTAPAVADLLDFMERRRGQRVALPEFFTRVRDVQAQAPQACVFPGLLARETVRWLDDIGLAPDSISHYAAISHTIADRPEYFPPGVTVSVAYPPSSLQPVPPQGSGYFFTCSRLDAPKRIALLIQAMALVPGSMTLKIAGRGPEAEALQTLAKNDPRIEFLGFVNDSELVQLYANARAVLFVPYEEDYGLIAAEAMASGKPVVTATDSGGPNELIQDGETGFSVAPTPEAIATAMRLLAEDPARAERMGQLAQKSVIGMNWDTVIRTLVEAPAHRQGRPSLCVATTFPIYPPRGGGQSRVFNLYRKLARYFDITIVSIASMDEEASDRLIAPGLREVRVPKSQAHHNEDIRFTAEAGGASITDVVMPELIALTPAYEKAFACAAHGAAAMIACHPYLLPVMRRAASAPLWYEAQDVEFALKTGMFAHLPQKDSLIAAVRAVEQAACAESALIFACTRDDIASLAQEYGFNTDKAVVVPNGVAIEQVAFLPPAQRSALKARLGLDDRFTALFVGSLHQPNIAAVEDIVRIAPSCPDMTFLIVGTVGQFFASRDLRDNVGLMNGIDDLTLQVTLQTADCGLNPMTGGSGSNLKMLEYFAAGLPVISSRYGARGLDVEDGVHLTIAETAHLPDALRQLRDEAPAMRDRRVMAARRLVEERFDWRVIADRFYEAVMARRATTDDATGLAPDRVLGGVLAEMPL